MNSFIVVSYYTLKTLYEEKARKFIGSLKKYNIPHYVEAIDNLGDWYKNTGYKPTFLKRMLKKFPEENIVWVDCDALFFAYPDLFRTLDCDIGVYVFDTALHKKGRTKKEVLSGTIFLRNNEEVCGLVDSWEQECKKNPNVWDQKSLEKILQNKFYTLPKEYCTIFDVMRRIVKKPVIVHYQASRGVRKNKGRLT